MKVGQTQAVTAVIITGITLSAVSATYIWGTPILEKRQSQQQLVQTEDQVRSLYQSIDSISNSGEGTTETLEFDFSEDANIRLNESGNYIEVSTSASSSPYAKGTWFLLEGERLQGLSIGEGTYARRGQDQPGVIALRATGDSNVQLSYRVEFRNMYTETASGNRLEQVDLQSVRGDTATGDTEVVISNEGTEIDSGSEAVDTETGETIDRERTVVTVEFR
ncbi:MAG: hypothetical protein ACI977_000438 [Candidatus Nanohaloarchaea archaeon]|jgi:hypothetical protein